MKRPEGAFQLGSIPLSLWQRYGKGNSNVATHRDGCLSGSDSFGVFPFGRIAREPDELVQQRS